MKGTMRKKTVKYILIAAGMMIIGGLVLAGCSSGHSNEIGSGPGRRVVASDVAGGGDSQIVSRPRFSGMN